MAVCGLREIAPPANPGSRCTLSADAYNRGEIMNNLVKDFARLLEGRGLVIVDEDKVSQVPNAEYAFAKQIFKSREVLVPLLTRLAIGIKDNKKIAHVELCQ